MLVHKWPALLTLFNEITETQPWPIANRLGRTAIKSPGDSSGSPAVGAPDTPAGRGTAGATAVHHPTKKDFASRGFEIKN